MIEAVFCSQDEGCAIARVDHLPSEGLAELFRIQRLFGRNFLGCLDDGSEPWILLSSLPLKAGMAKAVS